MEYRQSGNGGLQETSWCLLITMATEGLTSRCFVRQTARGGFYEVRMAAPHSSSSRLPGTSRRLPTMMETTSVTSLSGDRRMARGGFSGVLMACRQ